MMKYRDQSDQELTGKLAELRRELFELRSQGRLEKPHQKRAARREIARVLTVMAERKK